MAITDIKRNVVTTYKADTSDHKRALVELQDKTKKLADEQSKTSAAFEKFASIGTKAMGIFAGASLVVDGYQAAIEKARLSQAAAGVDIEKLSKAAGGLKTNMQLLQDAAKFNSAAFKLTGEQMATAERAMRALTSAGFEQEEVSQKVLEALVKLEGDGLKDFGVRVREASTDADKFTAIMEALAKAGANAKDGQLSAAEGAQAAAIRLQDSWHKLKTGLGDLAIAFTPVLDALARAVNLAAQLAATQMPGAGGAGGFGIGFSVPVGGKAGAALDAIRRNKARGIANDPQQLIASIVGMTPDELRATEPSYQSQLSGYLNRFSSAASGALGSVGSQLSDPWGVKQEQMKLAIDQARIATLAAQREAVKILGSAQLEGGNFAMGATSSSLGEGADSMSDKWAFESTVKGFDLEKFTGNAERQSKLEQIFGPVDQINGYALAFQGLQGAVAAAMDAWITGAQPAGEAIKQFVATAMKATATQMGMEAIKEGAYALAALAMRDVPGAVLHGKAALMFGVAAAGFGAGAKLLGGSGGSGGGAGAGSAAPTYNANTARAEPERQDRIIVIGNAFGDDSPRQRQLWARRLVDQAMASGPNSVVVHS